MVSKDENVENTRRQLADLGLGQVGFYVDTTERLFREGRVSALPTTFLITRSGTVLARGAGFSQLQIRRIGGNRVTADGPRRGVACGVLLEDTRLPPFLTVRAALETVCALRNVAPNEEIDRVVAIARVGELMARTVSALSKGQPGSMPRRASSSMRSCGAFATSGAR